MGHFDPKQHISTLLITLNIFDASALVCFRSQLSDFEPLNLKLSVKHLSAKVQGWMDMLKEKMT